MSQVAFQFGAGLPWDRSAEDEKRFRKIVAGFLVFFLIFVMIMPNIPVPEKKRDQVETIPPRLAKLVMEKKKPPPPPPPKEEKKEEEKPKEEEKKKEEKKKEEPKPDKKKTAKEKAKAAIAVFDDLADLRDQDDLAKLKTKQEQKKPEQLGSAPKTERSLLTRMAAGGSGGVAVSKASSGGGGSGTLAGVTTTEVESAIEDPEVEQQKRRGKDGKARRTTEDIQLVFDRHKGSIYSLYRRALRKNPALEGTLVLRLVIQPSGEVTKAEVVSSELGDEDLERKIVLKVRRIDFGAMDVEVWDDTYPIDFIPS
ncbi:MAG: AgmX/PglI C-terminal domain-containing protein [Ketobacteraceae bacterium]|nr:AgmX/PglI C-terminal domain-containing protein [Ketobacteraceae bacterium]